MSLFLFTDITYSWVKAGPTAGSKLSLIPCPQQGSVTVRLQVQLHSLCNEWVTVHVSLPLCLHSVCVAAARMDLDKTAELQQRDCMKIWKNKVSCFNQRATLTTEQDAATKPRHPARLRKHTKLLITPSPWAHSHRLFDEAYLKRMCNIFGFKIQHVCDSLAVWSLFRWRSSKASPARRPRQEAEELRCQYLLCQRWASPPERFLWWVCLQ